MRTDSNTGVLRPAMSRREALRTLGMGAALGAVSAGAVYAASPTGATSLAFDASRDAELIRLGGELVNAWRSELDVMDATRDVNTEEAEVRDRAAYDARRIVIEKIAAIPATTIAGLGVKSLAMATCEIDWLSDEDRPELFIGDRLKVQIRRDVRRAA